jgi:hypothetical protein
LLLAITAGRAESGSWTWGACLFGEILLFAGSVGAAGWVVLTLGDPYSSGIGLVVTWTLGFVVAVVLGFLEYAAAGLRARFVTDLRGSLWPTRFGFKKL